MICKVLREETVAVKLDDDSLLNKMKLQNRLSIALQEIHRRNQAMVFRDLPSFGLARLGAAKAYVQVRLKLFALNFNVH